MRNLKEIMKTAKLYRYQIPIKTGLVLKNHVLQQREGLLLCLRENECEGWGEIAPLPSFSTEDLKQAEQHVREWIALWQAGKLGKLDDYMPSVAFGVSCALAELAGELGEQGNYRTAPLCAGNLEAFAEKIRQMPRDQGGKVAKLKVGRGNAVQDGHAAAQFLHAFPDLHLRLDANRGWSLAEALCFAEQLPLALRPRIQFIEEPCATPSLSLQFAAQTGVAIAWDETVREPNFFAKKMPNLTACIIKPTLIGSIQRCVALIAQIHQQGLTAVISSSLESSLGLTQLARLAHQYTPNTTPGLDTLNLMPCQILRTWQDSPLPVADLSSPLIKRIL